MRNALIWVVILMSSVAGVFGGNPDTLSNAIPLNYDTNFIKSYRNWMHIAALAVGNRTDIEFTNTELDNNLKLSTNSPISYGFSLDYEWISLEYTKTINGIELADSRKGKTESFSFRLGLTRQKFRFNAYYKNSQGYYIKNIEDFIPDWFDTQVNYPHFDDLRNQTYTFMVYYTFNHRKFSNMAALWQIDRQLKSAGSPVIGLVSMFEGIYSNEFHYIGDSIIVGDHYQDVKKAEYFKLGLTAGYMHTFAIKKRLYIHGGIIQGLFYNHSNLLEHLDIDERMNNTLGTSLNLRFTMGYNGKKFYGGVFYILDSFISDLLSTKYELTTHSYARIYIGYRFYIKKRVWMKKVYL